MIELWVIAVFPKKLNSVSSTARAHYLVLFLLTFFLIVNMNYFWTIRRQTVRLKLYHDLSLHKEIPAADKLLTNIFQSELHRIIYVP